MKPVTASRKNTGVTIGAGTQRVPPSASSNQRRTSLFGAIGTLGALALLCAAWITQAATNRVASVSVVLASFALLLVCLIPLIRYRFERNPIKSIEPTITFSMIYFLIFGLGAMHAALDPTAYGRLLVDPLPGLLMALAGLPLLLIGYYALPARSLQRAAALLPDWNERPAIVAAALLMLIGAIGLAQMFQSGSYFFLATATSQPSSDQSVIGFLQGLFFVGLTILAIVAFRSNRRALVWAVLVIALVCAVALLPTGRRYWLLYAAAAVVIPYHVYRRAIPVKAIVAALLALVFVLYPVGQLYRTASVSVLNSGPSQVPVLAQRVASDLSHMTPGEYLDFSLTSAFGRVNYALILTRLEETYPQREDYLYGQTYLPAVTSLIPRYFWQDKPPFDYYNQFGRSTGMLLPTDTGTTVLFSSVGELYLNFGPIGLVVGMLLYGLLFKSLYSVVQMSDRSPSAVLLYSLVFLDLVRVEGPLGPALPGDLRWFLVGIITLFVFGAVRGRRKDPGSLGLMDHPVVAARA
jgi:O-antigen polysaccharide polymerase Wzy